MKKATLITVFLSFVCLSAYAQNTDSTIYLFIANDSALEQVVKSTNGTVTPIFRNSDINSVVQGYTFKKFQKAFPTARLEYMQQVYAVVADNTNVAGTLKLLFPDVFTFSEVHGPPVMIGYVPSDWPAAGANVYTWYLDYINATQAWGYTHGDPNVVIGITDNWFDLTNPDLAGKIVTVDHNSSTPPGPAAEPEHGTLVAGLVAGATDNSIGYPAIGFNCRLELSDNSSDGEMFYM